VDENRSSAATALPLPAGLRRHRLTLALLSTAALAALLPLAYGAASRRLSEETAGPAQPVHPAVAQLVRELVAPPARAEAVGGDEPISSVGHGAFFDRKGQQIVPTAEFVAKAQDWYRQRLLAMAGPTKKAQFAAFERRLNEGLGAQGQAALALRQRSLAWLVARSPRTVKVGRMQMKINALEHRLGWLLASHDDRAELRALKSFRLDAATAARLGRPDLDPLRGVDKLVTANRGQAYLDECRAADVPMPPSINVLDPNGVNGWRSLGFIPTTEQFIEGTPAEVRVFESPKGMCIALPRYTDEDLDEVFLDGVICLSRITSKVCFWDNQMNGRGFRFTPGTQIPIGVADLTVDPAGRYQGGGTEIEFGSGGVCTNCHAGENPYIIHPKSNLGDGLLMGALNSNLGLPTFAPDRYIPIVAASWPQNQRSQGVFPTVCSGCHAQGNIGGRLPHVSTELNTPGANYCNAVLAQAIVRTMPPDDPGSLASNTDVQDLLALCNLGPNESSANRGDPHLTTTNGVNYDFQSAGEFVSLRNSGTGFELQTRQTPVLTTFTPGASSYTGLQSCVSLNTAAALRVAGRRITFQPSPGGISGSGEMEIRLDGRVTTVPANGISLGGNNRILRAAIGGGIDVRVDDGTRVIVTPNFWASEGYHYLNVEILNTPAREGILGPIFGSSWLPRGPNGSSFGPKPANLASRHAALNGTFADAWRVTGATSLFDYAAGSSTATFTNKAWPPPSGSSCKTISGNNPWPGGQPRVPVQPTTLEKAETACRSIEDKTIRAHCVYDVQVTGNLGMADAYRLTLGLRATP
jgi:hypothetical protein